MLIIDGNSVYEIDEECLQKKKVPEECRVYEKLIQEQERKKDAVSPTEKAQFIYSIAEKKSGRTALFFCFLLAAEAISHSATAEEKQDNNQTAVIATSATIVASAT